MIIPSSSSLDYSRCIDTSTATTTAIPSDYSYSTSISRYIDGNDVYIDGVRIKDYINKKLADVSKIHPDLDHRKYKVVMGSIYYE